MKPALEHLGDNFEQIDKKRALEVFRQAFAAAAALEDAPNKVHWQAHISGMTARLNKGEALYQIPQRLAVTGDFDQGVSLTEMVAAEGPLPLRRSK